MRMAKAGVSQRAKAPHMDLKRFLAGFPVDNKEAWQAIGDGLKTTFGSRQLKPESLIEPIRVYFKL
jgi:hypothetical protein